MPWLGVRTMVAGVFVPVGTRKTRGSIPLRDVSKPMAQLRGKARGSSAQVRRGRFYQSSGDSLGYGGPRSWSKGLAVHHAMSRRGCTKVKPRRYKFC